MRVSVPREIALGGRFPSKRQAQAEAQRLAFNAICGNGDDHPRNHGVLCAGGRWSLSPAYDIAPQVSFGGSLATSITRDGHMQAAGWALLRDCETFGYAEEEAGRYIVQAIATLTTAREAERAALAFKADDAPTPTPEKWLGAASLTHPGPLLMAPLNRRRLQASPVQPPGVRWSPREDMPRDTLPAFTT